MARTDPKEVRVARINARQAIAVALISAATGIGATLLGAGVISGKPPLTQLLSRNELPSCADYEISFHPRDAKKPASPPFEISGHSKPLPKEFELWVFTASAPGTPKRYWPKAYSDIAADNTWRVTVFPDPQPGAKTKHYAVFIVGEDGRKLINYYKTAMMTLSPKGNPEWIPITETPSDMVRCPQNLTVTLE